MPTMNDVFGLVTWVKLCPKGFDNRVRDGVDDLPRGHPTVPVAPFGLRDPPPRARGRKQNKTPTRFTPKIILYFFIRKI